MQPGLVKVKFNKSEVISKGISVIDEKVKVDLKTAPDDNTAVITARQEFLDQ